MSRSARDRLAIVVAGGMAASKHPPIQEMPPQVQAWARQALDLASEWLPTYEENAGEVSQSGLVAILMALNWHLADLSGQLDVDEPPITMNERVLVRSVVDGLRHPELGMPPPEIRAIIERGTLDTTRFLRISRQELHQDLDVDTLLLIQQVLTWHLYRRAGGRD